MISRIGQVSNPKFFSGILNGSYGISPFKFSDSYKS